ncbi:MAG: rod shape-determining protein MreC [Clostridia bacterium]|nr:rod shape-determining protein MreC [Clostridia bacterium]
MPSKKKRKTNKRYTKKRTPEEIRLRRIRRRNVIFTILVIIAVAAVVFFLILRNSNDISLAENGIGSLFSRVQSAFTTVTGGIRDFTTRWHNYGALEQEYNELSLQYQQTSLQLDAAQEAIQENARLKTLLEAQSRYESLDPIYAKVIARAPGQWFETFSINRGKNDGVSAGMAVANGDGLVGRVYEAGMNYAKVICIIDSRSAVACMVQSTRDNGIMRGEVTASSQRAECYVYYLPSLNNVVPGDVVITSGTDSLFPKGLHIGTVTAVSMDAGSEGSYAVVAPSVDFRHLEEVFVLREVIETDSDENLPSTVNNMKPIINESPTPDPQVTPTPSPTPAEATWSYPSASVAVPVIETLPEDEWVRNS